MRLTERGCEKHTPGVFAAKDVVGVDAVTAKGRVTGRGRVLRLIEWEPCGASGTDQPVYLVAVGEKLWVFPHEVLSPYTGGGE